MEWKKWFGTTAVLGGLGLTAAAGLPASPPAESALAPTRLEVDLSERELYLYHGGERVNTYPVAIGEPDHPTPTGDFEIDRIVWNPAWVPPDTEWGRKRERQDPDDPDNPMVGAKLFFRYPDYYIHGTDAEHTLGEAESHGCVRMEPGEAMDLAKWVQEHGGEARSEAWFERVRADDGSKHEVALPDPVPIVIHD